MVQKKLGSSKLGIKDDHVKTDKGLLAKLKQSFVHQNDVKSRAELKKKMKKSKSIKFLDSESLRPPPAGGAEDGRSLLPTKKQSSAKLTGGSPSILLTRKPLPPPQPRVNQEPPPQPGKPPHSGGCGGFPGSSTSGSGFLAAKKQSTLKQTEGSSPNYMKSTSSFEARKEERSRSPVSNFRNPQPSISVKSSSPKNTSMSSSKGSRSLSRTSSLKLVRTLTKSRSFKPPRSLSKKCSPTALFDEFDAQKPTCSSTLKDSKFPNYLTLSPGSTEAEGTSAMKVCPYTYCSLNGHHHAALPPLKCFLSARRRVLKTQKSFKLGCLSPRRTKPTESDSKIYPVTENLQEGRDFFVEIYTKDGESLSNEVDAEVQENQEMVIDEIDQEKQFSYCFVDEKDQGKILIDAGEFEVCDMDWVALSDNQDSESGYSNSNFENDLTQNVIGSCLFLENQELDTCEDLISQEKIEFGGENETQEGESFQEQGYLCLPQGNQESDYCEDFLSQEIPRVNDQEDLKESEFPQDDIGSCLFPEKQELDSCQDFLGQEKSSVDAIDETIEEGKSVQEQGHSCLLDINQESDSIEDSCNQKSDSVEDSHDQESDPIEDSCNQEPVGEDSQEDEHSCLSSTNQKVLGKEHSDDDENIDEIIEFELSQAEDKTVEDEAKDHDITKIEEESQDSDEKILIPDRETKNKGLYKRGKKEEDIVEDYENPKWGIRGKRISDESAADPSFNPKEPNYLPVEPEEDGEKVDLRHQELDERKNSEEWMVDLALRRAVNNLAPSRKRRVALLVEAFEKVMPIPKYESHFRYNSSNFALSPRPIQACS
jgi:hypothetical protein